MHNDLAHIPKSSKELELAEITNIHAVSSAWLCRTRVDVKTRSLTPRLREDVSVEQADDVLEDELTQCVPDLRSIWASSRIA